MLNKDLEKLKLEYTQKQYFKYFLRQGTFSLHYSRQMDCLIKQAYEIVLKDYFENFLPQNELIPFCVLANNHYATNSLCVNETVPLILSYEDIKGYHLKPMIKTFIEVLNDLHLQLEYNIIELKGLKNLAKNELKSTQIRFICGSKLLFKKIKQDFNDFLKENKEILAENLLKNFQNQTLPFLKQEFNIKKDCGGLNDLRKLENLLALFKDSPKNYALNFIDEKCLSELRLASEFLLTLKSALNLQSGKDDDEFSFTKTEELVKLLHKKDQKNFKAEELLIQKSLQSRHLLCLYAAFLASKIQKKYFKTLPLNSNALLLKQEFKNLNQALEFLNSLEDRVYHFDIAFVFALKNLDFDKTNLEKALKIFENFFYKKHSFCILKLLFDSGILKEFYKQIPRFLSDEESDYSFDIQAFLTLQQFEKEQENLEFLKQLQDEEKMILKFVIFLSAINNENAISIASIYRSYTLKFDIKAENLELGLRLFKNFNALKELVEKEDIYNPVILLNLLSKVENLKTLELLYLLTLTKAQALGANAFFCKALDKLLQNAKEGFEDENLLEESAKRVKKELTLKRTKIFLEQDKILQDKIIHIKSNLFIIKNSFENIIHISKLAKDNDFKFWLENEPNLNLQLVALKDFNAGIILNSLTNLNLIFMSFFELFDDKIYLKFEYDNIITQEQKNKLIKLLNSNLQSSIKNKIKKPIIKKDELKLDLNYSKNYAKLNLNTKDQQGLMAFLMNVFKILGLSLSAAKIQTIRQRTRNTFIFQKNQALLEKQQELITSLISE
ncbi:nucleotidyltransferase [Campylobacter cuniculorum]|uniref:[protein-PII] uridylyltransferase family protein n=1 Tax=Campylobacter cuniculorum TaxID=374106 RepID=UPI0023F244ED|nr:nucleotidyltransferase [Campylobacter cuniculorum]